MIVTLVFGERVVRRCAKERDVMPEPRMVREGGRGGIVEGGEGEGKSGSRETMNVVRK
jgi:hypothetical protein